MRLRTVLVPAIAAALLATVPARADQPGWYIGGGGGWAKLAHVDASDSTLNFTSEENNGFRALAFGGYDFGGVLRVEGEYSYHRHDVKSLTVVNDGGLGAALGGPSLSGASAHPGGTIEAHSLLLNGIATLLPSWRISPYVGGGVGAAQVSLKKLSLSGTTLVDDSTLQLAGQGIVGIGAKIAPRVSLALDYRYFLTADPTFKDVAGAAFHSKYREQSVLLTLTYRFGAPASRPAAPQPVAAPAVPPALAPAAQPSQALPQMFFTFFDFDQATLTPAGAQVVEQAAAAYRATGVARIDVTGYTDLAGPAAYNLQLSKRRADTVRVHLLQLGVPAPAIVESARGKDNPRVPTADGVREPQNRRVEIVLP